MKPGLAALPLEVWADVFEHPMITRQLMARIADDNGDPGFTAKLQKLLHGCGKHSLRYLKIPEYRALLTVSNDFDNHKECEFPETGMPENIKTFKWLSIGYLDDKVLGFLEKIKSLFTNVYLVINSMATNDLRILLTLLLPMLGSIRAIFSTNACLELFEQHFPETLALSKELHLRDPNPAYILTCLNWLSTPQDFGEHGPRFLWVIAREKTIFAIVDALRKQFLAATRPSAFVIFLEFHHDDLRADEFKLENGITKEGLTVRNAIHEKPNGDDAINYVEIVRNPMGAEARMREWINKRAYFEEDGIDEANKKISIWRITKQVGDKPANVQDDDAAVNGPSTSTSAKGK